MRVKKQSPENKYSQIRAYVDQSSNHLFTFKLSRTLMSLCTGFVSSSITQKKVK